MRAYDASTLRAIEACKREMLRRRTYSLMYRLSPLIYRINEALLDMLAETPKFLLMCVAIAAFGTVLVLCS